MSDEIKVKVHSWGNGRPLALVYFDPITGKKVNKSSGTRDEREAERAAAVLQAELNSGKYRPASKTTWKEFRERYEREHLAGKSKQYAKSSGTAFNHVDRVLNPDRLTKLTSATLSRFQAELRAGDGTEEHPPMKESTIANVLRHLKAALRWAAGLGLMAEAPRIKAASSSTAKGRPITGEEFERMLTAVLDVRPDDSAHWISYLWGLWLSGLRLGESLALSWDADAPFAVDLSGRRPAFRIDAQAQKSRKDEVLPMTPDFATWLLQTPETDRAGRVFKLGGAKGLCLFQVSRVVAEIGEKAGVVVNKSQGKFASAHDLRRSFGARWAKKIMPALLQRLMRHANISTTMAFYANLSADEVADGLWAAHKPADCTTSCTTSPNGAPVPVADESVSGYPDKELQLTRARSSRDRATDF